MKEFVNKDLTNIVTPVEVKIYKQLLKESGYNAEKTKYLVDGFTNGFSLQYSGPHRIRREARNLILRVGSKKELWNKVMTEVKAGRYAGPYEEVPFKNFIQSPIGLVPKDKGKKTRLIFHLSYPKDGDSVNSGIPDEYCSVEYPDFLEAIELCLAEGEACYCAKSDMSMAFRNVPMDRKSWKYLVLKCEHPISKKTYYFVDKCLLFGASISCAIFQEFSNSVAHIVKFRTNKPLVNYLDDYFFAAPKKLLCDGQVEEFLQVCKIINFPVSLEKTVWGTQMLTFLGLLIDTINQLICIPVDKLERAMDMIQFFLNKRNGKVIVHQIQKLAGSLNFLCRCIIPGRAFVRRLYSLYTAENGKVLLPHHHVRLTEEVRMDLQLWKRFLEQPECFYRPFIDARQRNAKDIDMYSDASGCVTKGVGAYCGRFWTVCKWNKIWMQENNPSIEF